MKRLMILAVGPALVLGIGVVAGGKFAGATFPGGNGKIAFTCDREGNPEVCVMNQDGNAEVNRTEDPHVDVSPAWSPDGRKIAFATNRDGNFDIYIMNADGTEPTPCTDNEADDFQPAWSPDGGTIAFFSHRDDNDEIYFIDAACTAETRCTDDAARDINPDWSPDGTQIVWERVGDIGEIFVVDVSDTTCGTPAKIENDNPTGEAHPSWSPSGDKIVFRSNRDSNNSIYTMNPDGTEVTQCTFGWPHDNNPTWSPDGSRIAFTRGAGSGTEILAFDAADCDGQAPEPTMTPLTANSALDDDADWQPLVAVGGVAELPSVAGGRLEKDGSSGGGVPFAVWGTIGIAAAAVALGGAAWYARRWVR